MILVGFLSVPMLAVHTIPFERCLNLGLHQIDFCGKFPSIHNGWWRIEAGRPAGLWHGDCPCSRPP